MSAYRELLLGCGHSRVKRMQAPGTPAVWQDLVTLDNNPDVKPDVVCDLDVQSCWYVDHGEDWPRTAEGPILPVYLLPFKSSYSAFRGDYWDEVHAYEVLEHLGGQGDARVFFAHFSEIYRVLKPGGYLCATVPSRFSPWLWGDPSHRRAILPESLVFLDQSQYTKQLDGPVKTPMSDFRSIYQADFRPIFLNDDRNTFSFVLQAVKPSRALRAGTSEEAMIRRKPNLSPEMNQALDELDEARKALGEQGQR